MTEIIGSGVKEKSLYLIQIQYLDERLERCQLECHNLEKQNKDLVSQYGALEKDKKDTTEHLKPFVVAKQKMVDELAEQLAEQQQAAEQEREALKLQHSQQIQELQEQVDRLNSESVMRAARFEEQQEQLMQWMQQLSDKEPLKKQLVSQKEEHEAAIHSLKKEAELGMKKMIEKRQKAVDDCVKMETSNILKKERAQHSERSRQLRFLRIEAVALQKEKDALQGRENDLFIELDDLKKDFNKITQESFTRKKEVEQLTKKCQQLEVELTDCSITHKHLMAKEETLRQELASVSKECCRKISETDQLAAELQRERSRKRQLEGVMQEAVIIIRNIQEDSEKGSETQWKMQRLLEVLESTAPQGTGSALRDSTEKSSRGQKLQTTGPKPVRAETLNLATDPLFLMARYRPGDLGLVPRPTWKHKPAISRTGAPSTSTQLPLNRKLCSHKTSSSVDPSDPAPQPDQSDPAPQPDQSDPAPQPDPSDPAPQPDPSDPPQQADSEAGASTSADC
ncbi:cilia- and flagella-associated protein 157 [Siniperca chuatsi]|uniref:cilia- and flagella-associated protein 157 n=1 Tax=Siniperca chuatsi TaxID=119488 RepID=UPI001CE1B73A|nr:cilia- and flagella-associated protein 157 [Siniperca chuatsi]